MYRRFLVKLIVLVFLVACKSRQSDTDLRHDESDIKIAANHPAWVEPLDQELEGIYKKDAQNSMVILANGQIINNSGGEITVSPEVVASIKQLNATLTKMWHDLADKHKNLLTFPQPKIDLAISTTVNAVSISAAVCYENIGFFHSVGFYGQNEPLTVKKITDIVKQAGPAETFLGRSHALMWNGNVYSFRGRDSCLKRQATPEIINAFVKEFNDSAVQNLGGQCLMVKIAVDDRNVLVAYPKNPDNHDACGSIQNFNTSAIATYAQTNRFLFFSGYIESVDDPRLIVSTFLHEAAHYINAHSHFPSGVPLVKKYDYFYDLTGYKSTGTPKELNGTTTEQQRFKLLRKQAKLEGKYGHFYTRAWHEDLQTPQTDKTEQAHRDVLKRLDVRAVGLDMLRELINAVAVHEELVTAIPACSKAVERLGSGEFITAVSSWPKDNWGERVKGPEQVKLFETEAYECLKQIKLATQINGKDKDGTEVSLPAKVVDSTDAPHKKAAHISRCWLASELIKNKDLELGDYWSMWAVGAAATGGCDFSFDIKTTWHAKQLASASVYQSQVNECSQWKDKHLVDPLHCTGKNKTKCNIIPDPPFYPDALLKTGGEGMKTLFDSFQYLQWRADCNMRSRIPEFIETISERRWGWYTIEQEADEFATGWLVDLNISPAALQRKFLASIANKKYGYLRFLDTSFNDCVKLFCANFPEDKLLPLYDFTNNHHGNCFRAQQVALESRIHSYYDRFPAEFAQKAKTEIGDIPDKFHMFDNEQYQGFQTAVKKLRADLTIPGDIFLSNSKFSCK